MASIKTELAAETNTAGFTAVYTDADSGFDIPALVYPINLVRSICISFDAIDA